jgi:hypothetical protein
MTFQILAAWVFAWWSGRPDLALAYIAIVCGLSYFVAGAAKLAQKKWRRGLALQEILLHSNAVRKVAWIQILAEKRNIIFLASWAVVLFEISFPLVLLNGRWAMFYLLIGVFFHFANFLIFGLNRFFWAWLAAYPAVLLMAQTLGFSAATAAAAATVPALKIGAKTIASSEIAAHARSYTIKEEHSHTQVTFRAVPFAELDKLYHFPAKGEVKFVTQDGFYAWVPVSDLKKYQAALAFERTDRADQHLYYADMKQTFDFRPFYLIWGRRQPVFDKYVLSPYQVSRLEVMDRPILDVLREKSRTGGKASALGDFKTFCLPCHSVDGVGGTKGINFKPGYKFALAKPDKLMEFIDNPRKITPNISMPPFQKNVPHRTERLKALAELVKQFVKK